MGWLSWLEAVGAVAFLLLMVLALALDLPAKGWQRVIKRKHGPPN